jgi:hypothetical protein
METEHADATSNCDLCGGSLSKRWDALSITVPCRCGTDVGIAVRSIDPLRGVMVGHYVHGDSESDPTGHPCPYTTYVPPTVLCPACGGLVRDWQTLVVRDNPHDATREMTDPNMGHYRDMARDLARQYGSLRYVRCRSHFPTFEIEFVFEREVVRSGRRTGAYDIHFLALGYEGEGPTYARAFLDELGFPMALEEIAAVRPGAVLGLEGGKVAVRYE